MAENSKIQWTDHTFNPWWGCAKVSPGCTHCYAETFSRRTGADLWGAGKARRRTSVANWREPVKWDLKARGTLDICVHCNAPVLVMGMGVECGCGIYGTAPKTRRSRVFCASMADWLDADVQAEWLADLLDLIHKTPRLDWLLLTKRPEFWRPRMEAAVACGLGHADLWAREWLKGIAPRNVWIGTTVEDQKRADERIPALLQIPARVRFLSCEPLLEAVDLRRYLWSASIPCKCGVTFEAWQAEPCGGHRVCNCRGFAECDHYDPGTWSLACPSCGACICKAGFPEKQSEPSRGRFDIQRKGLNWHSPVDWVIVGGESGAMPRPFNLGWARSIVGQCQAAGVPVFVKQFGHRPIVEMKGSIPVILPLQDHKGGDWSEWPEDLRVRQFPRTRED